MLSEHVHPDFALTNTGQTPNSIHTFCPLTLARVRLRCRLGVLVRPVHSLIELFYISPGGYHGGINTGPSLGNRPCATCRAWAGFPLGVIGQNVCMVSACHERPACEFHNLIECPTHAGTLSAQFPRNVAGSTSV